MNKIFPDIKELCEASFLLFDKPINWTSFDLVRKVRKIIKSINGGKKIKIGHAGTLDPLATGLLILCTGSFTKQIYKFQELEKEYIGTMVLGATTPSFDLETKISESIDVSFLKNEDIINVSQKFIGETMQLPPIYSAIRVKGRRAYNYARAGDEVDIKARPIVVKEFEIEEINLPQVKFRVVVSKGTYIRSLINDLGANLKVGAYLSSLCRTHIGEFELNNAFNIEEFENYYLKQICE